MPRRFPKQVFSLLAATAVLVIASVATSSHREVRPVPGNCARPVALIGTDRWDFGTVDAGEVLVARFQVRNAGDRRLVLNEKSRSCECISRENSTCIIPPGRRGELVARLKTRDIEGSVAIEIRYATSDPQCPLLIFTLLADICQSGS